MKPEVRNTCVFAKEVLGGPTPCPGWSPPAPRPIHTRTQRRRGPDRGLARLWFRASAYVAPAPRFFTLCIRFVIKLLESFSTQFVQHLDFLHWSFSWSSWSILWAGPCNSFSGYALLHFFAPLHPSSYVLRYRLVCACSNHNICKKLSLCFEDPAVVQWRARPTMGKEQPWCFWSSPPSLA